MVGYGLHFALVGDYRTPLEFLYQTIQSAPALRWLRSFARLSTVNGLNFNSPSQCGHDDSSARARQASAGNFRHGESCRGRFAFLEIAAIASRTSGDGTKR